MNAKQIGMAVLEGKRRLLDVFEVDGRLVLVTAPDDQEPLSDRQVDVCGLVAEGHADKWIGFELGIARSTVATHLAGALDKLNLTARTDIARVWPLLSGTADSHTMTIGIEGRQFTALVGDGPTNNIDGLTDAEHDVMFHAVRGASNNEIADLRGTSSRTVANQLASIYRKLGLCSRTELAAFVA